MRPNSASSCPTTRSSYFVSYYDYYQPEAYVPQTDTFIEKDSIDQRRGGAAAPSATANSLLTRRDTRGRRLGFVHLRPRHAARSTLARMLFLQAGQQIDRDQPCCGKFVDMQYKRNDIAFTRGTFRVRGDTVEIIPVYEELAIRIEFFGDEIDRISTLHPLTGDVIDHETSVHIFPGLALRRRPRAHGACVEDHRGGAGRSAWPSSRSRARCWRRSA